MSVRCKRTKRSLWKGRMLFPGCLILITIGYRNVQAEEFLKEPGTIRIMFYNVENYFDTIDNGLTRDEEFLPEGDKHWTQNRYWQKTRQLFKVIAAVGEGEPPAIIALAEIENRFVLHCLAKHTLLSKYPYEIIHYNSPDVRGIDVAMLYRSDKLQLLHSEPLSIHFPDNPNKHTRDILYGVFSINHSDTMHVFVNHWPSRRGGEIKSAPAREFVARVLRHKTDSIFSANTKANIVITGDFNDEPDDSSLASVLGAKPSVKPVYGKLYNLSLLMNNVTNYGTYRYQAHWNMFDQFIVSGALLTQGNLHTCIDCLRIAQYPFLLQADKRYGGYKPFRTYQGPAFKGGFSDHLPVYLYLYYGNSKQ